MRTSGAFFVVMLLTVAAGNARLAGQEKEKPAAEAPKEMTVEDYDSKTKGAIQVKVDDKMPTDWFDVLQNGKRAYSGNPKILNKTVELAPGDYVVDVNRTQRKVTVEAGKKTILWTGELVVEGETAGAYWYPMDGKAKKLSSAEPLLNKGRPLFPGTYTVFVHTSVTVDDKNLGKAEVKAGKKTTLKE